MLAFGLAGCGDPKPAATQAVPEAQHAPRILCARGKEALAPACTLERTRSGTGEVWTIRFPDGAFRRLAVADGEIGAADGAEPLRADGDDVVIAGERYRLPDE